MFCWEVCSYEPFCYAVLMRRKTTALCRPILAEETEDRLFTRIGSAEKRVYALLIV